VFRYNSAAAGNFTVTGLTNIDLTASQATTIKVLMPPPSADRTVTLTGMTVNGSSANLSYSSIKVKKDKSVGFQLDVIKNVSGNYYVYGSLLTSE